MKKRRIVKKKNITINDLSIAMSKGFEHSNKQIENLAIMTAKGFEKTATKEELKQNINEVREDINEVKENLKATKQDVLSIGDRFVPRNEFDHLLISHGRLEKKVLRK